MLAIYVQEELLKQEIKISCVQQVITAQQKLTILFLVQLAHIVQKKVEQVQMIAYLALDPSTMIKLANSTVQSTAVTDSSVCLVPTLQPLQTSLIQQWEDSAQLIISAQKVKNTNAQESSSKTERVNQIVSYVLLVMIVKMKHWEQCYVKLVISADMDILSHALKVLTRQKR